MDALRRVLGRPAVAATLLGHAVFALVVALSAAGALERLELLVYDAGVRLRAPAVVEGPRIAVVTSTEADLARLGWPLSDAVLAEALSRLRDAGAAAVAVDLYRDRPVPPGSDRLDAVLAADPGILWAYRFGAGDPGIPPPAALRGTDQAAFADVPLDADGVVRRALLFLDDGDTHGVSLGLAMAMRLLGPGGIVPEAAPGTPGYMRLGASTFVPLAPDHGGYADADTRGYQYLLDYARGPQPFAVYTLGALLAGEVPAGAFDGRAVFVGTATESVKDSFETPFSSGGDAEPSFGVVLHARMADQILRHAAGGTPPSRALEASVEWAWVWAWCALGAALGYVVRVTALFALGLGLGAAALLGLWYAAFAAFLWVPAVAPLVGGAANAGLLTAFVAQREKRDRAVMMRLFSSHVSADVAREIWRQRETIIRRGRPQPMRLTATVLFSDIDSFTTISEQLEADALMDWLNGYMEEMASAVLAHGGVVDKYIGDAVMAVFGVPVPRGSEAEVDADAENAVRAALAMAEALPRLNARAAEAGLPAIAVSIGIHTGPLVAGSLGSAERMEYTVIGDSVNTAARLEAFAKTMPVRERPLPECRIVVSDATWGRLGGRYDGEAVGPLTLKGKHEAVQARRLLGSGGDG